MSNQTNNARDAELEAVYLEGYRDGVRGARMENRAMKRKDEIMTHPYILAAVRSAHTGEQKTAMVRGAIARGILETFGACRVLNIDAWRHGSGWDWNNWRACGWFPLALLDANPRAVFRYLREHGGLSEASAGRVALRDDGYNLVVESRSNGEPLFAIEYGAVMR